MLTIDYDQTCQVDRLTSASGLSRSVREHLTTTFLPTFLCPRNSNGGWYADSETCNCCTCQCTGSSSIDVCLVSMMWSRRTYTVDSLSEAGQETSGASSKVLPQHSPHKGRGRATPRTARDEVKTPLYFSLFTPVPPFTCFQLFARSAITGRLVYLFAMSLRASDPTLA